MRHKVVDVDGPVHYIDFGGAGKPLVMVHGLGGSALNWMAVGPEFAKHHRAVALDLAGFGETPLYRRSAAVGANAELVSEFIERLFDERATVIGNSMGGHIAVLLGADHPDLVDRIVLVDPAVPGVHVRRPAPQMLGVMAALSVPGLAENLLDRRLRSLTPEQLVHEVLALVCADPSRLGSEIVEAHIQLTRERERLGAQSGRAFLQASRSLGLRMADPRFWTHAREVKAPVLVVHGERDRLIPVASARELVRRIPRWRLEVLEGVGHVPMMETPDLFMRVVGEWMADRIPARSAAIS